MDSDSVPTVSMETSTSQKENLSDEIKENSPLKREASNVPITLQIRYKSQTFPIQCDLYETLKDLKEKIDKLTNVDPNVQKLVNKSITSVKRDDATTTLKDLNLIDGQTLLLVGATRAEILSANSGNSATASGKDSSNDQTLSGLKKEPLCKQTRHEKVLKMGEFH